MHKQMVNIQSLIQENSKLNMKLLPDLPHKSTKMPHIFSIWPRLALRLEQNIKEEKLFTIKWILK